MSVVPAPGKAKQSQKRVPSIVRVEVVEGVYFSSAHSCIQVHMYTYTKPVVRISRILGFAACLRAIVNEITNIIYIPRLELQSISSPLPRSRSCPLHNRSCCP